MPKLDNRWKNRFRTAILQRGQDYFNRGLIKEVERNGDYIFATVGNNNYEVSIRVKDNIVLWMGCDCPYAADGNNCKHEAAALYAYDAKASAPKQKSKVVANPFEEHFKNNDKYYFNLYELTRHCTFTEETLEKARQYIIDKKAKITNINLGYLDNRSTSQSLYVEAYLEKGSHGIEVQAAISKEEIIYLNCRDFACRGFKGYGFYYQERENDLCEHKIALLLLLEEHILRINPGDYTDLNGNNFLNSFKIGNNISKNEEIELKPDIALIPKLEIENDFIRLGFKIGNTKMYVARKFSELTDSVKNKKEYTIGSKTKLDFSKETFNDESRKYFDFIESAVNEEKIRSNIRMMDYYSSSNDSRYFNVNSSILLYGSRLDDFFDIAENSIVELNDKNRNKKYDIELKRKNPELKLVIGKIEKSDGFKGIRITGYLPKVVSGSKGVYYIEENCFYKVDEDYAQILKNLERIAERNKIDLTIGKKHLAQFYNHVLPSLKDKVEIINNDEQLMETYAIYKPVFDYYFDVKDGQIICKVTVTYGDSTYNLFNVDSDLEIRDYIEENRIGQMLFEYFKQIDEEYNIYSENNDDLIYALMEELVPELMKTGNVHSTDAFDRLKVKRKTNVSVAVSVNNNLLELDISTDDMSLEELSEVINSYREKKKYHKLKSGELIRVDDDSVEKLDLLLSSLNISLKDFVKGKLNIPSYRALYLDKFLQENDGIYDNRDVYFKRLVKDFKTLDDSEYEVDESLKDIMRNYQKDGFKWLKTLSSFNFGGILADEMGLGKTLQMISLLLDYKKNIGNLKALIICPSSLVYNWLAEFDKFAPDIKVVAVTGNQKQRKEIIHDEQYEVYVTSYDLLRRDIDMYGENNYIFEILDEAQYIKTASTANAKACKIIKAQKHFALTGTPIENNLSELWSIFDYLMPGFLFTHEKFRNVFEVKIVKEDDEEMAEKLKTMISPFILRRRKVDVLSDLPEKIEETIKVKFDDVQQKLYDSQVLKISKIIENNNDEQFNRNKIAVLAELTKIRQICCDPTLLYENYNGESAKKEACIETIRNAIEEGHKILLFSQFTSMLEILKKALDKEDISYFEITGKTPKEERLKLVNSFNENDIPLFLISLKAGGTGLNLTGADIVIHYDPWWNIAAQNQATDRAHRIGQNKIVTVYKIIAKDSIEEKILDLQEKKKELAESILSGEPAGLSSLSKEELLDLLSVK